MRIFPLPLLLAILSAQAYAQNETSQCVWSNGGSCWQLKNSSAEAASLSCMDSEGYLSGRSWGIPAGESKAIQFSASWGDGLGFPEPGVAFSCELRRGMGASFPFAFKSLEWGDHVEIAIRDKDLSLVQQSIWTSSRREERTFSF